MEISTTSLKRVDLVEVAGRIDSTNASQLDEALRKSISNGRHNLVLDLSKVDYMSSAGLRAMVAGLRDCKKRGGDLRIATPSARVSEVLSLAGLDSVFQVFDDPTVAVGSF